MIIPVLIHVRGETGFLILLFTMLVRSIIQPDLVQVLKT